MSNVVPKNKKTLFFHLSVFPLINQHSKQSNTPLVKHVYILKREEVNRISLNSASKPT